MKRLRILVPLTLLTLFLCGCRDDIDLTTISTTQEPPTVTEGTANFSGMVMNENREPLRGITVELLGVGLVTETDADGRYEFPVSPLLLEGTAIAYTDGFLRRELRFITAKNSTENFLDVIMMPADNIGSISGEAGGTVSSDLQFIGPISVSIPAGTAQVNGQPYNGIIQVEFSYRDATNPTDVYQSSNNFPAKDPVRGDVLLESYGIGQVRFTSENGEDVTFPNNEATISIPFPRFINAVQQDSMFVWSLTDMGWDRQEAIDNSSSFPNGLTAQVAGSGNYNWAIPFQKTMITGRLLSEAGVPQPFLNVFIQIRNGGVVYSSRTALDGSFCAPIPLDQEIEINYNIPCEASEPGAIFSLFFDQIGPFSSPVDLGDVVKELNSVALNAATGTCSENTVNQIDDLIIYVDGEPTGSLFRKADGSVVVLADDCDTDGVLSIQAVQASDPFVTSRLETWNVLNTDGLELIACSDLTEGESLDIQFGSQDTTASEGSFLLLRDGEDEFRQRVSYRGGNPQISSFFELTLDFPTGGSGTYFGPDATVSLNEFLDEEPGFAYRCEGDCESLVINVNTITGDDPILEGSFNYEAEKVNRLTNEVIESNISVSGAFAILR